MHYSTIDRAPMFVAVVRTIARLDVAFEKMDEEDKAALWDWTMSEGATVSGTAKALVLASLISSSPITATTVTKKEDQSCL
jgi:hypothetical protein